MKTTTLTLALLLGGALHAQQAPMSSFPEPSQEAPEANLPTSARENLAVVESFRMTAVKITPSMLVDGNGQHRLGQHRALPSSAMKSGAWMAARGGRSIWRLSVQDPGALGLRVHFRNFHVGANRVWVHNGAQNNPQVAGPFTQDGAYRDGDFFTNFIFGDTLVVEYESRDGSETLPFEIEGITHLWEFMGAMSDAAKQAVDTSCMLDAMCYANNKDVSDALPTVVFLVIPAGKDAQGNSLIAGCTGTMVNDRNNTGTPFLLTAGHCITNDTDARGVTVYWNYQTDSCGGTAPAKFSSLPSVTGSILLSQNLEVGGLDYAFVALTGKPNTKYSTAGWDTTEVTQYQYLVSVSHPRFLPKRFAYLYQTASGVDNYKFTTNQGRVDHGSSGSALFSTGAVIRATDSAGTNGQNVSACTLNTQVTSWTKFSSIYGKVSQWLEDQVTVGTDSAAGMLSPAPGSTLSGPTATFKWNDAAAQQYYLYIGTTLGGKDILAQDQGGSTSTTVGGLPTDGSTLYVRLWSHFTDGWKFNDYTYTAAQGTTTYAQMTSPANGTNLKGSDVTFTWTKAANAIEYYMYIGSTVGAKDLFAQNLGTTTSIALSGLPQDGSTLYVRLWTHLDSGWFYYDYSYTSN